MKALIIGFALFISVAARAQQGLVAKNDAFIQTSVTIAQDPSEVVETFNILPSTIKTTARVQFVSEREGWATLEIRDRTGEIILEQQMVINEGTNSVPVFFVSKLKKGIYTSVLTLEDKIYMSKLVKE